MCCAGCGAPWAPRGGGGTGGASSNSEWYGVVCSESGSVLALQLDGNGLVGTVSCQIGVLTSLQELDVYANPLLAGTIPNEVMRLTAIQLLGWHTTLLSGTLTEQISQLSDVTVFGVHQTRLSGSIPDSLLSLAQLDSLGLQFNLLSGTLPQALDQLSGMKYFMVFSNIGISGILPPSVSSMDQLIYFYALKCSISGTIPTFVGSQDLIESIYVSVNHKLSGTVPPFSTAPALTALYGNNASISGTLGQLPGAIQQVDFHGTAVSGVIPETFATLNSLVWIDLLEARLSGAIPPFTSRSLEVLSVNQNPKLSGSLPSELFALTALEWLLVHGTIISGTIPDLSRMASCYILNTEDTRVSGA